MSSFFKSTPDSKGGFTTIEWSLGDYLSAKTIGIVIAMALAVVFTSVIPAIWLLLYFISDEKERRVENVVAILAGIYYLIDYHNGWVTFMFLRIFLSDHLINLFTYFNAALLITHITLLFFGRKIWFSQEVEDETKSMTRFIGAVLSIIVIGYLLAQVVIPHVLPPVVLPR